MIETSVVGFDGHAQLVSRLEFLLEMEIPRLQEVQENSDHASTAALTNARREAEDIRKLIDQLVTTDNGLHDVVRPNDCVTVYDEEAGVTEEMILHDAGLIIRAPGFISVDSPLGRAVIGRRAGEPVAVQAPGGPRRYVIRGIGRGRD